MMLVVREADVYQILCDLSPQQARRFLDTLSAALILYSKENRFANREILLHQPSRTHIVNKHNDTALFMPSSDTQTNGIKLIALPSGGGTAGAIILFTPSGEITGMVGPSHMTAFRTALATMTLFAKVRHISKKNMVIFGSGRQVEWHLRLAFLLTAGEIENVWIINRGRERLDNLEKEVLSTLRLTHANVSFHLIAKEDTPRYNEVLRATLKSSDVIFCCTPSTSPLFPYSILRSSPKDRFISVIGSYKPHMREIDTETLLSGGGRVFVDSADECLEESGELIDANVTKEALIEIGEYLGSQCSGYPEGNVVLKCVGMGIMDLVSSRLLLELAEECGVGQQMLDAIGPFNPLVHNFFYG
ncbi:hypothetical protein BDQ94DRAFT_154740 [Aspergillus welwitschiae]|uniref:NAD(P)-binding protein n=1 Tax=Aspergillus welwitschiae TaxID=1341132 RepID=A0A3F3PJ89_9EURO|nr:hypothetical protein BDQ94DRAFT_154740 [Aspergillus welwitschiae]RDH26958.1 hypothetical protein BDQ94DRAFT_154740 [Aspergillus welwitschiae]